MKLDRTSLASAALSGLLFAASSSAVDLVHNGALPVAANRIVGMWLTEGATSPCGSSLPPTTTRNTLLFQAGGTVVESARFPPAGIANVSGVAGMNQRGPGLGTWTFDPRAKQFSLRLRFDWYVDGKYHGYQTIDREITLSSDGLQGTGPVQSTRFGVDGHTLVEVCGVAISDRL